MRDTKKAAIILFALLMILTNVMTSFAAINFTDVAADYWGRQHIEKMAEKSIVSGMTEGGKLVFKPESPVSRVQAIHMIYRTLRATNKLQSTESFISKYQSVMTSYNIPEWAYEAVAYALEYNIINGSELATLMVGTQQMSATRQQVAVYLGKAMNSSTQASSISPLTFIDREMIDAAALPYVQLLVDKKIISGDNNNRFNPQSNITRAQMASICSKAYDVLSTADVIVEVPVQQAPKTTTKFRTIDFVATETRTVLVRDNDDNQELYQLLSNTEIIVNGVTRNINNLAKGQKANFIFDEDNKLIKIEVNPSENKYKGVIERIIFGDSYDSIVVRNDYSTTDRRRTFRVYDNNNVVIELDDKKVDLKDLKEEEQVDVVYDGDRAVRIISYSKLQDITGILDTSVNFSRYPFRLRVKVVNNEVNEYEIEESVVVRIDNKRANLEDLVRGDIVTITLNKSKVSRIEATSINVKKKDEGIIQSIMFGNPNKLTIVGKDDEEVTYDIANNVSLYIDDERSTIYDLRVGYNVELELQGNTIIEIEGKKIEQRNSIEGEIVRFHDSINRIIVRAYDTTTRRYEEIPVYVNNDTRIIDEDGKSVEMRYLDRRDEVFITGRYDDDVFVATRIIVLND